MLSASLNTLSIRYANLKRLDAALAASEEAVTIRRDLYAQRPDVFGNGAALNLSVMSGALTALGRSAEGRPISSMTPFDVSGMGAAERAGRVARDVADTGEAGPFLDKLAWESRRLSRPLRFGWFLPAASSAATNAARPAPNWPP